MNAKGPTLAFSLPSRPRRKNSRIVAPSPPASTKPAPSAPAATIGRRARSLPVTSVASPRPARRSSAAAASWSRSLAIARRTSCGERVLARAIALQCLRGQTRLGNCLLRHRRHASLHSGQPDERENRLNEHEPAADDEQREPGRDDERKRRSRGSEREPERQEEEDPCSGKSADP